MQTGSYTHSLRYTDVRTYAVALLFVAGNILLPRLAHMVPQGGVTWLPIYFFTLIGAYMYGWRVGLVTALLSPVANHLLSGMPVAGVLPAIMLKSVLLSLFAGLIASRTGKATLLSLTAVVAGYQVTGTLGEWLLTGDMAQALQDFRIGIPGILLQIFGGWLVIGCFRTSGTEARGDSDV